MKMFMALTAVFAAGLIAAGASAETLDFSYSGSDGSATWTQSSTPTVLFHGLGAYTDVFDITGSATKGATTITFGDLYFVSTGPGYDGGISITDGPNPFLREDGPQLYNGSEATPVFAAGSYTLANGTLTVTAVTEPATWAMLLIGAAGLGAGLRGRRDTRVAAA